MALIDDVKKLLDRLSNGGWDELFAHHGINIGAANLRQQLTKKLNSIDRTVPGFEDFASDGERGIEPRNPSHSLLYHALASPNVQSQPDGTPLTKFPTLKELDQVENLVFGIEPRTLAQVRAEAGNNKLSVVVFACDYRPSQATSHRRHSDLMFSRTGVARVGTAPEKYVGQLRGFIPFVDGEPKGVRVLPSRYVAYLAIRRKGNANRSRPMRFKSGDTGNDFWIPVHKLFDGDECLKGLSDDIELEFHPTHLNEKLRRMHVFLRSIGFDSGVSNSDLTKAPYSLRSGLAKKGAPSKYPKGIIVPVPHASLVEEAFFEGERATFPVPTGLTVLSSTPKLAGDKSAPEFVHARHRVNSNGTVTDLNQFADVDARVKTGGYDAQHYVDYTADGVMEVTCEQLDNEPDVDGFKVAYSLISAPDFYPLVDQRDLTEWTVQIRQNIPGLSHEDIWGFPPVPLCDDRLPANLQFPGDPFEANDITMTAVVGLDDHPSGETISASPINPMRHSHLPDNAAGLFDPGWDVSNTDHPITGTTHMAAFGLGSPFPEDAKLCAAIAAFWPAVAPDIARSVNPGWMRSVSPLTDEEIGIGASGMAWDGLEPLRLRNTAAGEVLEYPAMEQTDYVQQALDNELTVSVIGRLTAEEYQDRVLATAFLYKAIAKAGISGHGQSSSLIYSFTNVPIGDANLINAQIAAGIQLVGPVFGIKASSADGLNFTPISNRRVRIPVAQKIEVFVTPGVRSILLKEDGGAWRPLPIL